MSGWLIAESENLVAEAALRCKRPARIEATAVANANKYTFYYLIPCRCFRIKYTSMYECRVNLMSARLYTFIIILETERWSHTHVCKIVNE